MNKETISTISVFVNLILALLKLLLGWLAKSSALIAEGLHSGIDVVSSLIAFWGIKIAGKKPTKVHPYGWARAEVLAGFVITIFLALAGLGIIWDAIKEIVTGKSEAQISFLVLVVMFVSVITNEVLARLKVRIGQEEESLALIADGKHSRVDVLSSAGVLIGLWLTRFNPVIDSLIALLVGVYILWKTVILGKEVSENLLDVADLEVEEEIKKICREEQVNLASIKTRKIGALTLAELEVSLPVEVKISRADELITELQSTLINRIARLEYVVIQIKGKGRRLRMLRGKCAETLERIGPKKKGFRLIIPYKEGKPYEDFGAPEYLVTDLKNGKEVYKEIITNPYYKIGRGHGVRFSRAVHADKVKTINIGKNAQEALKKLKIEVEKME